MKKLFIQFRSNIIAGLLVIIPVFTTIVIFFKLFVWIDSVLPSIIGRQLPPGIGLLAILVFAYGTGIFARNYVGKKIIEAGDYIIGKIPFLNKIYQAVQQILDSVVTGKKSLFDRVVLLEYPKAGVYSMGFVTADTRGEIPRKVGVKMYNVFVPTTPNPTSGFLLFVPETEVLFLEIDVETALKTIMSVGMVNLDAVKKRSAFGGPKQTGWHWTQLFGKKPDGKSSSADPRD